MHVRIYQSGQDRRAAEIDRAGFVAREFGDFCIASDGRNALAPDRHGLGDGKVRVDGNDPAIGENEVGGIPGGSE